MRIALLLPLIASSAWVTPDGGGSVELQLICTSSDRVLFLESTREGTGSYYTAQTAFAWLTVHLKTARLVRDPMARLTVTRDADDASKVTQAVQSLQGGRSFDEVLRKEGHTCSPREAQIYNKAKEIHYQQKGDQLVLSLEGVSRSLPWKAVRTPASEDPISCEGAPCPVAFDLRLKEGVLLVISQADIVSHLYRYVVAPVQLLDEKRSQVLNEVGFAAHKRGGYETSAALFTEAVMLDRKNQTAAFNAACAYARLGNAALAVSFLEKLPDAAEARKKARSDKDFDGIRTSPELQKFLGAAAD
jgi:hypothetical protein